MKTVFIVNPVSGKSDASCFLIPSLIEQSQAMGVEYAVERTEAPKHATEIARRYAAEGLPVRLIACGGDGTLNEVLAGAWQFSNAWVGCIPCGSGNDFVKNFSALAPFSDLSAQLEGTAVPLDLVQTNYGVSAAICSVGLDARVANGIAKFRRLPFCGGKTAYHLSILEQLSHPLGEKLWIQTDNAVFQGEFLMAAVCNGSTYGGGFCAAPEASLQDGLLDVVLIKKVNRLRIAQVVNLYKSGQHIQNGAVRRDVSDIVRFVRAKRLQISCPQDRQMTVNIDGECTITQKLTAEILPRSVNFIVPNGVQLLNLPSKCAVGKG